MHRDDAEIWAFCDPCGRWFYCESWFDTTAPAPTCPVCWADPSAIVNEAACSPAESADVRASVRQQRGHRAAVGPSSEAEETRESAEQASEPARSGRDGGRSRGSGQPGRNSRLWGFSSGQHTAGLPDTADWPARRWSHDGREHIGRPY